MTSGNFWILVLVLPAPVRSLSITRASNSLSEIGGAIPWNNAHCYIEYLLCATHCAKHLYVFTLVNVNTFKLHLNVNVNTSVFTLVNVSFHLIFTTTHMLEM